MTAAALLADLRARGVTLEAAGSRLRFRPREAVPSDLRAALAAHKAELLALLRPRDAPGTLRPGAPGFPETVARLLGLPLDHFAEAGACLQVRVPWWPEPLWFVATEADAEALVRGGVSRGRVWTAGELMDLLAVPGVTQDQARTVALAKLEFGGQVVEVRPREAGGSKGP